MFQEQYIFFIIFNIFFYLWNIISKFPEFNTREYSSTRKTPRHSEEMYDPRLYDYHYSVDYLLKDKINTKLRMIRLDDQIDTIPFSEILWRFEERPIPNCAFQPNIWQIYDYSAIEWKFNLFKYTFITQLIIKHTYKEVTVTITCMINNQRQIRLKCKLLIRKQHNHCTNTTINTSNQLYGVHCGVL